MRIKKVSLFVFVGLFFLGACTQAPPTEKEAARAYERAINTPTFNQHYLSEKLAKETTFVPKKLIKLLNCVPAQNQPGNVCTFVIKGSFVFPTDYVYGNTPSPIGPVNLTASGRFYKEKNGEWTLFYLSPKSIAAPNEKCTGIQDCVVDYPQPTKQQVMDYFKKLASGSWKIGGKAAEPGYEVRRIMGEADYFRPDTLLSLKKCQSTILSEVCAVTLSGIMTKVNMDMAAYFEKAPKPKIVRANIESLYFYPNQFQHP
ncbi:hypothetical protein ABH19_06545 [Leptospirillum sp. Group II 'CF-1']|jgi:hypothetical protein|uniref:hypothetical protein n=1 Tax=Leptospirillum sp. Group II 'CF-1' TaxID=1660083 RepID=UPI0006727A22|nr:hypothetical protein [Leptospirillum sp. Group II 'CF-1']AKS23477.1 hypothetical protein ABH19_06545 [Leptospirillum sp. Group II 'CF-1']